MPVAPAPNPVDAYAIGAAAAESVTPIPVAIAEVMIEAIARPICARRPFFSALETRDFCLACLRALPLAPVFLNLAFAERSAVILFCTRPLSPAVGGLGPFEAPAIAAAAPFP